MRPNVFILRTGFAAALTLALGLLGAAIAAPSEAPVKYTVRTHTPSPPADAARHLAECQKGVAAECHAAALDAYYKPRSPENDRVAFDLFKKACDAGYAASCNGLGTMFSAGRGTAQDLARAVQLYRQACEAGSSTGCEHLDMALQSGRGVTRDPAAAERARARGRCVFEASLAKRDLASCPAL